MGLLVDDADILAVLKLGGVDEFNAELGKVNQKVKDGADTLAKAVNVGIAAGATALGIAVKNASEFERSMANVNTIANLDPSGMQTLGEQVKQIAMVNPANFNSLTSGLYDLVSSGVPATSAANALAIAAQAASAGLTGVDTAIQAGMANINAYGLPVSELTRVFDLQFQAVNLGVINYQQLATSIGNALPAAQNLKVPLEELYASVAQLTLSGIDPQSSTTYLGRLFSQLTDPEITGRMKDAGINVWGPDGSFRGLVAVLKDMDSAVKGMSDQQKANFFNSIGFTEQSNKAMLSLIGNLNGENGFLHTMDKMKEAPGAVNNAFKIQMETFGAQVDTFSNIIKVGLVDSGNAFVPILKDIVSLANENPEATKTLASSVVALAVGFGSIAGAAKGIQLLQGTFAALAASPIGMIAMGIAGVATALTAINTAVEAHKATVLEEIGATSDNIDKVGQLAGTIENLRGKKELTKDETIKLKDSEKDLGDMLNSVGLNINDYTGKLGEVKGAYEAIKLVNLNQQLEDLQGQLGGDGGILNSIAGGLAVISPALAGMLNDTGSERTDTILDRIKKVKDEIAELNKPESVQAAAGNINALGDAAAGTDGNGGAANKLKQTAEQLKAIQLAAEKQNYKDVKEMTGLGYIGELQTKAMAADTSIRGLADALANKNTGLIDKFPEVKTGGDNAALGISAMDKALGGLSIGLDTYYPKIGKVVDAIWKIADDGKFSKNEIPGLFKSIGNAAGEANPKVGGLFNLIGTFAESGFSPITLALGGLSMLLGQHKDKVDFAVTSWSGVETVLGKAGTAMKNIYDQLGAVNSELELDVLSTMQAKMENLSYQIATKVKEYENAMSQDTSNPYWLNQQREIKNELDALSGQYSALKDKAEEYTAAFTQEDKYNQATDSIDMLVKKYKELSDKFGETANMEGLKELLGKTVEESSALLNTLEPNSKAFEELSGKINTARQLLQGLVTDIETLNDTPVDVPVVMNPTGVVTPGQTAKLHGGGFPVAHDGYLAPNETFVKMLKNEMVLRPEATDKFGMARLKDFNATLDPASLAGGSRAQSPVVLNIIAGNTTPATWFKVSDQFIQPRINERTRKYEVKANPYAK